MRDLQFFNEMEERMELPKKDFMLEMKIAKLLYGYVEEEYDDTYDEDCVFQTVAYTKRGNNDVIFINPKTIEENDIVDTIVHETLHIVIWKLERIANSTEKGVRMILNENWWPDMKFGKLFGHNMELVGAGE